jgi:hypothetical protein
MLFMFRIYLESFVIIFYSSLYFPLLYHALASLGLYLSKRTEEKVEEIVRLFEGFPMLN